MRGNTAAVPTPLEPPPTLLSAAAGNSLREAFAELDLAAQRSACSERRFYFWHKSGTELMRTVEQVLRGGLGEACTGSLADGVWANPSEKGNYTIFEGARWSEEKADVPALMLVRNPFEMVASSFQYDLDYAEGGWFDQEWQNCSMSGNPPVNTSTKHPAFLNATRAVYDEAGPMGLPLPNDSERWVDYLHRLGEDEGLLASSVFLQRLAPHGLGTMVESVRAFNATPGDVRPGRVLCYSELVDSPSLGACISLLEQSLQSIGFPSPLSRQMAARAGQVAIAATRDRHLTSASTPIISRISPPEHPSPQACPQSQQANVTIGAHGTRDGSNASLGADRVRRLMRLDAEHGGALHHLAQELLCPLSTRYQPQHGAAAKYVGTT